MTRSMFEVGPNPADLATWVRRVHDALTPSAVERTGAQWGPVQMLHRTTRPDWFGRFDQAWAVPIQTADTGDYAGVTDHVSDAGREARRSPPTVDLVTAAFADVPADLPPAPLRKGDLGPRGEVLALSDTPLRMVWEVDAGQVLAWDQESGAALVLMAHPPSGYEQTSPARFLVHWATAAAGGMLVHGAVVGRSRQSVDYGSTPSSPPRGLLLLGDAGYGKSTSTLACLQHGWVTCGDDAVALFCDEFGWRASAVYAAVKTKLDNGPGDAPSNAEPGTSFNPAELNIGDDVVTWTIEGRKRAHRLTATDAGMLVPTMRLDGMVLLDPSASPDAPVQKLTPAAARTLTAPSTTLPMPFERLETLTRIGALASELPAFSLPRRDSLATTVADLAAIASESQPHVSVVVPTFNGATFVADAVRSIARQPLGRFEVIVVDDASTDDSATVVEGLRASLAALGHDLMVLRHEVNAGVAAARNTGLRAATGGLISFLDQDDIWPANRTEQLLAGLRRADAAAAFGRMAFTDVGSACDRPWVRPEWFESDHPGHVLGASLLRREVFDSIGLLNPAIRTGFDDVDWLMRLRDSSLTVVDVPGLAVQRRIHDTNASRHSKRGTGDLLATVRAHRERLTTAMATAPTPAVRLDVVIPIYDVSRYLWAAVDSALRQRGADVRVVVVDDGSSENIARLVNSWNEPRVTLMRHTRNRGSGAARNTGAAAGKAPWLGFLDADDLWPLDRTERLLREATGDELLIGQQMVFSDDCEPDPAEAFHFTGTPVGPLAGAMLFPRGVFERLPTFDEELRLGEFIDWFAQARAEGVAEKQVACVSLLRRSHGENTTRTRTREYGDYLTVVARARARARAKATGARPTPGNGPRCPSAVDEPGTP